MATTNFSSLIQGHNISSLCLSNITTPEDETGRNMSENETDISLGAETESSIPMYTLAIVSVLYIIFFALGATGNGLVVFVISKYSQMRNSTNLFLLNLSVADIIVLVICMPTAFIEFYSKDVSKLGSFMCRSVAYLENSVSNASVLTLLCIGFERFYAICSPVKSCFIKAHSGKVIVLVWTCALVVASPFLSMSEIEQATFYDGSTVDVCSISINSLEKECYVIMVMVMLFLVSLGALVGFYVIIVIHMSSRNMSQGQQMQPDVDHSHQENSSKQVIYMLIVIVILFVICLLPIRVVTLWYIFSSDHHKTSLGLEGYLNLVCFARVMFYMNSTVKPVLYNFMSPHFRKSFWHAIARENSNPRRSSIASMLHSLIYTRKHSVSFHRRSHDSLKLNRTSFTHCHNSWYSVDRESRQQFMSRSRCNSSSPPRHSPQRFITANNSSAKYTAAKSNLSPIISEESL